MCRLINILILALVIVLIAIQHDELNEALIAGHMGLGLALCLAVFGALYNGFMWLLEE